MYWSHSSCRFFTDDSQRCEFKRICVYPGVIYIFTGIRIRVIYSPYASSLKQTLKSKNHIFCYWSAGFRDTYKHIQTLHGPLLTTKIAQRCRLFHNGIFVFHYHVVLRNTLFIVCVCCSVFLPIEYTQWFQWL